MRLREIERRGGTPAAPPSGLRPSTPIRQNTAGETSRLPASGLNSILVPDPVTFALALGYHVSALQAGGAVRVGMGMRCSGVRGQAKRDTAFPQGDKRQRGPDRPSSAPAASLRPPPRCARCRPQTKRCRASLATALQKSCGPGYEHFSRSRSLHGRVVMGSRVVWHGEDIGRTAQHSLSYRPGSQSAGIVALASPGGSRITVSAALGNRPG
jgi:hypothetical protein